MFYIAFEGIDGTGKSTVMKMVADRLRKNDVVTKELGFNEIITTREPKGVFRDIIMDPENKYNITELARMFLFQADRAIHTDEILLPVHRNPNTLVITDRGPMSTLAYQSLTTDLSTQDLVNIIHVATRGIWPDFNLIFEASYPTICERLNISEFGEKDHFEAKGQQFFEDLTQKYRRLAWNSNNRYPSIYKFGYSFVETDDKHIEAVADIAYGIVLRELRDYRNPSTMTDPPTAYSF